MSIVRFLLLDRPIDLPSWPGHVHRIETPEDAEPFAEMSDLIRRTVRTRMENVETVFATLEAGSTTIIEVIKRTGLGRKVVQRAMVALENDGRIIRVRAKAANQSHLFRLASESGGSHSTLRRKSRVSVWTANASFSQGPSGPSAGSDS